MNSQEFSIQVFDLIDKILSHYAGPQYIDEVKDAKKIFFDSAGILEEHSDQFDLRMSQFFDWYFFTRDLNGIGHTPLEAHALPRELRFSDEEFKIIDSLKQHRHSLFAYLKSKGSMIYLKDLFSGKKYIVDGSKFTFGFNEEEIFEVRLVPFSDTWVFTRGFCFHPRDAKKFILSEIKKHKKDPDLNPEDLMLRLIKMRYRAERYKHVRVDMIYSDQSKLGV